MNAEDERERTAATAELTVTELIDRGLVLSELAYDIASAVSAAQGRARSA